MMITKKREQLLTLMMPRPDIDDDDDDDDDDDIYIMVKCVSVCHKSHYLFIFIKKVSRNRRNDRFTTKSFEYRNNDFCDRHTHTSPLYIYHHHHHHCIQHHHPHHHHLHSDCRHCQ